MSESGISGFSKFTGLIGEKKIFHHHSSHKDSARQAANTERY